MALYVEIKLRRNNVYYMLSKRKGRLFDNIFVKLYIHLLRQHKLKKKTLIIILLFTSLYRTICVQTFE